MEPYQKLRIYYLPLKHNEERGGRDRLTAVYDFNQSPAEVLNSRR